MVVGRLMAMALAAVGLSVGGFELGATKVSPPSVNEVPADVPADHPIAVALGPEVSEKLPNDERKKLLQMARQMEREQVIAVQFAATQAKEKIEKAEMELVRQQARLRSESSLQEARMRTAAVRQDANQSSNKPLLREAVIAEEARLRALQLQLSVVRTQLLKQQEESRRAEVERHYSVLALQQMAPNIREQVKSVVRSRRDMDEERGFGLLIALRNRDDLGLTPAQVTILQLLQADFIRRFAPIRQAYEERVDTLHTKVEGNTITLAPPTKGSHNVFVKPKLVEVKASPEWKVYRDGKPFQIEVVHYVIERQAEAKEKTGKAAKTGQATIRYIAWTDEKDLTASLTSLKKEIDEKVMKALNATQRSKLKEMIDQSLAAAK